MNNNFHLLPKVTFAALFAATSPAISLPLNRRRKSGKQQHAGGLSPHGFNLRANMKIKNMLAAAVTAGALTHASTVFPAHAQEAPPVTVSPAVEDEVKADAGAVNAAVSPAKSHDPMIRRFAGEDEKVKQDIDETTTASITRSKTTGSGYGAIISRYASENGVPAGLAAAVVRIESNYRASARGAAGEVGLMQIKPSTARAMGYRGSIKGLYDPETNIRYGMKYLGMAHKLGGGDTCGTILRYNAGHAARRMNPISAAYCAKVKRHLGG